MKLKLRPEAGPDWSLPPEWVPPSDEPGDEEVSRSRVAVMIIAVSALLVALLVGVALVSRAVFVDHRSAREARVLSNYAETMRGCIAGGTAADLCSSQVYSACLADPFWSERSFTTLWIGDGRNESLTACGAPAALN